MGPWQHIFEISFFPTSKHSIVGPMNYEITQPDLWGKALFLGTSELWRSFFLLIIGNYSPALGGFLTCTHWSVLKYSRGIGISGFLCLCNCSFWYSAPQTLAILAFPRPQVYLPILKETSNLHLTYFCCANICSLSLGSKLEQLKWLKGWSLPVSHLQEIVVCCCLCSMSWEPLFHTFCFVF